MNQIMNKMINIGAVQPCSPARGQFISKYFLADKSDGTKRCVLNLKNLNKNIITNHFKIEDYEIAAKLIIENSFMARIDLKNAYFLIPMHNDSRKFLRFYFKNQLYEFLVLSFGLNTARYIFTKIIKPVVIFLRSKDFLSVVYLDDFLCIGQNFQKCFDNLQTSRALLQSLGFIINEKKSDTVPTMNCQFLGFVFDSESMTISLPNSKRMKILYMIKDLKTREIYQIKRFAQFIGNLIAACPTLNIAG